MKEELSLKEKYTKTSPNKINDAYSLLLNQKRMLESYSGTKMDLSFSTKGEKDSLENQFTDSSFRKVRILPIVMTINKYSKESDMISVLSDIYTLEVQTDLKVRSISKENNGLVVKGELYGI